MNKVSKYAHDRLKTKGSALYREAVLRGTKELKALKILADALENITETFWGENNSSSIARAEKALNNAAEVLGVKE